MKNLYTIILDFEGGTYVGQAYADSPQNGVTNWEPTDSSSATIRYLQRIHDHLVAQIQNGDVPARVADRQNAWCMSGTIEGKLYLAHLILTVAD